MMGLNLGGCGQSMTKEAHDVVSSGLCDIPSPCVHKGLDLPMDLADESLNIVKICPYEQPHSPHTTHTHIQGPRNQFTYNAHIVPTLSPTPRARV